MPTLSDHLPRRTSEDREGPYLVVCRQPPGTTPEQAARAFEAAQAVFDKAGVDPVEAGYGGDEDDGAERGRYLAGLWAEAERAATIAGWAPRSGEPEATLIKIYVE